ncbi:MAG TPA: hypothetical protein PLE61_02815 [Vicinamibacterales bacterium]|nr:hypothetical protein [Vicinamibacterales bacterium]HPW19720.1 hypothetical protein [Vicinamibacterales bacterium]
MIIRRLRSVPEFQEVLALEAEVWGYTDLADAVGIPMFVATLKRGGILLGAYDGARLAGFVYSMAAVKDGRPTQWSHMLAVRPACRAAGVARALKLEQRRACLAQNVDLVEWSFDPLAAVNAHLNLRRLGATVREYAEDLYGASDSPLHRGAPTDRFIAEWRLRSPRVETALAAGSGPRRDGALQAFPGVVRVNATEPRGAWQACAGWDMSRGDDELAVAVPGRYQEMLASEPALAREWRAASREMFAGYLGRGYQAVDFAADGVGGGTYLLRRA